MGDLPTGMDLRQIRCYCWVAASRGPNRSGKGWRVLQGRQSCQQPDSYRSGLHLHSIVLVSLGKRMAASIRGQCIQLIQQTA